jgi:FAD/FMN-containing dehydrogenase
MRSGERNPDGIVEDLVLMIGDAGVLEGQDVSDRFDGWPPERALQARCIARPNSTEQVSKVLQYCNAAGIKVIPHGGRTGLSGGARSGEDDIVLSLERLNRIESVNPVDRTMTVNAGVPLATVQSAAQDHGMLYPVDIGARGSATIGGTIATNAGGTRVLRYGSTREQVLGLEAVLADGTIISSMNRLMKNNAGYDIKQLFIGTEGTLGIVTRAVLRLRSLSKSNATAFVGLASFDHVLKLLERLSVACADVLTSFEVMWPGFVELVIAHSTHRNPLSGFHKFCVLVELGGSTAEKALEETLGELLEHGAIDDAVIAQNARQAAEIWNVRDDATARAAAMKPNIHFDIGLPQSEMNAYVVNLRTTLKNTWPDAKLLVFGHLADGNLHINISVGVATEATLAAVDRAVYEPLSAIGGTLAAEHGVGLLKRDYLALVRGSDEIALMRKLKNTLDPNETLNPGKVIPRC